MSIPNIWWAAFWAAFIFAGGLAGNAFFGRSNDLELLLMFSVCLPLAGMWLTKFAQHIDRLEDRIRRLEDRSGDRF